ncbi:UTP--glucose-1-phosphate uridylyltransferase GalU [Desulfuromonas acetoxidans]|uniref:UTP--glucose-1-phosphate uridylyltransferase GalU n=1 Tax=Desulfuromonas acetoxidans TaxID=891 RepID=UPI002931E279|nr:UTP--glucose-1-phosphate uridylyltransferase GalU [Desulfuromonas acetoxidans]
MHKRVEKVVIPVAGFGTRMLPATKAIPKEMLPVVDKPIIQYVVEECVSAGIQQIVLITHPSKQAIENHFDTSFELESALAGKQKEALLDEVTSVCPQGVTVMQTRQGEPKGLGHAILCARPLVGDAPFAIVLPDVLIDCFQADQNRDNLAAMVRRFHHCGVSQIMVEPVPQESVSSYGIVDCAGAHLNSGGVAAIKAMVEKPPVGKAPSNLAIVGRYVLTEKIWPLLAKTQPGAGGEIQLTDAMDALLAQELIEAFCMKGKSHDCGNKLGYLQAIVEYARQHARIGNDFNEFLSQIKVC